MWDLTKAVAYLNEHAEEHSLGRCAEYVRKAVEAGGVNLVHHPSAKDYGRSLERAMFQALPGRADDCIEGDVAVIQPIPGHPHGHMAMYNGTLWISDFRQPRGYYPGPSYRALKPPVRIYRYAMVLAAPPSSRLGSRRLA